MVRAVFYEPDGCARAIMENGTYVVTFWGIHVTGLRTEEYLIWRVSYSLINFPIETVLSEVSLIK